MPRRLTQEEFEQRVLIKLGPDYKVLGEYKNKETKIQMIHYICGNKFLKRPGDIMSKGSGCPYCNGNQLAKYNEQWVVANTPYPYVYIQGFTKMSAKCTFYCNNCNSYFQQTPSRLINEKIFGCNCCSTKKLTHEDFLNQLGKECLNEYEILSNYTNIDTKIKFKHKKCGTEFELSPYKFIYRHNKKYCPICYYKKSKGEVLITNFLEKNNIQYQKEFSFPDLKNKKFDFYLPEFNSCIEYDGIQHFKKVDFFGGEQSFKDIQRRDRQKNLYCLKNNIKLFRIPYSEYDNINQILHQIYKEKSSTTIEKYLITEQSTL